MIALLIYGLAAFGILVLIINWIHKPIGGYPKPSEPKSSQDPAQAGTAWREQKKMDDHVK
jgi:hypothetical protein